MSNLDRTIENPLSKQLNVIISLLLHFATKDAEFNDHRHKTGDLASYLRRHDLSYEDIAAILDSPIGSVRELVRLKGQSGKKNKKK